MRFFQHLQNDGISPRAQIRLLDNTFMRLVFSFTAVPFVGIPFAIWIYLLGDELGPTITWIMVYLLCAVAIRIRHRRYLREAKENDEDAVLRRWLPRINKVTFIHGLGISSLYLITPQTITLTFSCCSISASPRSSPPTQRT